MIIKKELEKGQYIEKYFEKIGIQKMYNGYQLIYIMP